MTTAETAPETLTLDIEDIAFRGEGIARHQGQVVFVAGTIPGERVKAEVVLRRKDYLVARVVEVLSPSPDRIEPPCPYVAGR